jgi:heme O synthase-like polyprenyltransferase
MTYYFAYSSFALGFLVMVVPASHFFEYVLSICVSEIACSVLLSHFRKQTSVNARKVFRMSLLYLPLLMLLMIFDKFVVQEYILPKQKEEEELQSGSYSLLE